MVLWRSEGKRVQIGNEASGLVRGLVREWQCIEISSRQERQALEGRALLELATGMGQSGGAIRAQRERA